MMGNLTSGISPEGESHWALVSYIDIKGAIGTNYLLAAPTFFLFVTCSLEFN